ncbi:MAG TPA: BatD family protein [Bacteroidales bacterium]|nr:BatD family protein [Bacteroidales bacterium]
MRTLQVIILLIFSGFLKAQDVEFSAEASPNVLRVGDQFNLIFSANEEMAAFAMPDLRDFQLLGGPSQGHSQSVSSINGKITTTSSYQYTYFLRAVKEGKFTISPASIKVKNKVYKSNPITVEVLKASASSSAPAQNTGGSGTRQNGQVSENDLFVKLLLDKTEAYIGEQIMATVKIYTKTNLAGIDQAFKGPDFTGFFTEPIETPPLRNLERENVNGDIFGTGVIRRVLIIPQKTGQLTVEPFDLDVALRREVRRRVADPFFDDFSIPDIQEIPVTLKSKPVKINVKPLPPNAPPTFKGAVGLFKISSSLNNTVTASNEPLTLKVVISGTGNLKLINDMVVNVPYDMERYDPVINTKMDNALSGSKSFEYMIMPKRAGQYTIPGVEFTYFDARAGQYKTIKTESYTVTVEKGQGDSLITMAPGTNKEDVKLLNSDIRFIKTKQGTLKTMSAYLATSALYYLTYVLLIIIFIVLVLIRKRISAQHADIIGMKLRKADQYARKRLRKCETLLKQGNSAAFYEEMLGALWGYISDKLSIPVSVLSKDNARTSLMNRSVSDELIDQLFRIIDHCEMARYGFSAGETDKEQLYHDAIKVITSLQQKLR